MGSPVDYERYWLTDGVVAARADAGARKQCVLAVLLGEVRDVMCLRMGPCIGLVLNLGPASFCLSCHVP